MGTNVRLTVETELTLVQLDELKRVAKLARYLANTDEVDLEQVENLSTLVGDMEWAHDLHYQMRRDLSKLNSFLNPGDA